MLRELKGPADPRVDDAHRRSRPGCEGTLRLADTDRSSAWSQATAAGAAPSGLVAKRRASSSVRRETALARLERPARRGDRALVDGAPAYDALAGAAQKAGLTLRPPQLSIFGHPRAGTPLMQSSQTAGIDLPLKALAWEDGAGQVWLAYNDPAWLTVRHGVQNRPEVVKAMTAVLEALTDAAATGAR